LNPSEVSTPMTYNKKLDLLTIAPKQCAEALLNDLGHDRMTNGHWTHKIQSSIYHFLPEPIFNFVWLNYIGPDFIKERNNAIQKRG
jgi:17beta-estradiol 17-dehydrogenase / very-long-chain 3-oxoacyl-CoA reductase